MDSINKYQFSSSANRHVMTSGMVDYVSDGTLYNGAEAKTILVTSETDLALLPETYAPGTIAYTAGFAKMWMKAADGTWADCFGEA